MTPWKIAVLDRATLVSEPFAFNFPAEVMEYPSTRPEETAARIAGADVVVTNKVVITAEHIAANPQLKLIALAATGVDNVCERAAVLAEPQALPCATSAPTATNRWRNTPLC